MRAGGVRVILSRPSMKKGLGSVAIVLLEMFFQVAEGAEAAVFVFADPAIGDFLDWHRIQKMKFFGPARPEEEISLKAEKVGQIGDLWQFGVRAQIGERLIAEGQLVLNLASKSSPPQLE